ncbi:MAG: phenylacetate--CoA ligase family protein [Actinomycetota bacterium]
MDDDRTTGWLDPNEALDDNARREHLAGVLRRTVEICWEHSPHYRSKLEEAGLKPGDINGLDDLARIPITSKKETIGSTGVGTGTIPLNEAKRIYVSPGPMFYAAQRRTDPPVERGKTPLALAYHAMGFREGDIVLNTFSYHLVPAGFGLEDQLHAMGCAVIPAGPQNSELQAEILAKLPVAGYVGTPTFLKLLCGKADELGLDTRKDWKLEVAFVTAERLTEELRGELEERTGARVRQIYGSADGLMPAYECWASQGMHLHPDQILEVLDVETHEPVPNGTPGEVVATVASVNRPLLRLANQDLVSLRDDPCPCGRTGPRIERFVGRTDESTKVRGMFLYPEEIAQALSRFPDIARWQAVVGREERGTDDLRLKIELTGEEPGGFRERIADAVKSRARLRAEIDVVAPDTIPDGAPRLLDTR